MARKPLDSAGINIKADVGNYDWTPPAHLSWTALQTAAAVTDGIIDGQAAGDLTAEPVGAAVTVLAADFDAQPPCARNITATVAATTAGDVKAAAIVITGKNLAGATITESLTPTADTPATLTGTKAFASVDSVLIPAQDGGSVTVDIGWGQLIGLPCKLAKKTAILTLNDGAVDTAPTLAVSATALESNTVDFNGSLDGSVMDMYVLI